MVLSRTSLETGCSRRPTSVGRWTCYETLESLRPVYRGHLEVHNGERPVEGPDEGGTKRGRGHHSYGVCGTNSDDRRLGTSDLPVTGQDVGCRQRNR